MESAWCGPAQHDERMFNLIVASTSVFFVIPMFLLGFAYWRIGRTLKKSERRYRLEDMRMGSSTSEHSRGGMQSRRSIIRMLCTFLSNYCSWVLGKQVFSQVAHSLLLFADSVRHLLKRCCFPGSQLANKFVSPVVWVGSPTIFLLIDFTFVCSVGVHSILRVLGSIPFPEGAVGDIQQSSTLVPLSSRILLVEQLPVSNSR